MVNKNNTWELFFQISTLLITAIPLYFLVKTTSQDITATAFVIFGIILGMVMLGFIFNFIYGKYKKITQNIESNKKDLNEIRKDLNFKELFNKLEVRVKVVEELIKNKKGQFMAIDPRIIIFIVLIVLLYLFLREIGAF